jgi:hypothetical protein
MAITLDGTTGITTPGLTNTGTTTIVALTTTGNTTLGDASTDTSTVNGALVVQSQNVTPYNASKNRIINGAMAISQRGTSFSSPANQSYTLDRWKFWADGSGGTLAITQATLSPGELSPFLNAIRINQSVAATSRTYFRINQHIEGLEFFSGQQIVVSFYAKCASGTVATALRLDRYFGSGGSPSAADNLNYSSGGSPTITTTWTRYTALATVTSTSGKTYGTSNDSSLLVGIDFPTSGTFDVYVTGFQVEIGSVVTPFEFRPIGTELALCQRYYYQELSSLIASGIAFDTIEAQLRFQYLVQMRISPTVTIYDNAGNAARIHRNRSGDHANAATIVNPTTLGWPTISSTGLVAGAGYSCKVKADAEL